MLLFWLVEFNTEECSWLGACKEQQKCGGDGPHVFDELGSLVLDLGVYGAPETFFVDKSGIIRYRHVGVIDDQVWVRELRQIYSEML